MNSNRHHLPIDKLRIWQQNLNTSNIAQLALLNTTNPADWDVIALQEPTINQLGNTKANSHWRVVYPTQRFTDGRKSRVVMLINSKISTNAWKQIDFPSADVVITQTHTSHGLCTLINTYNDCKNDDTTEALEQFLAQNMRILRPNDNDHLLWLGDFNRHHPLWDEDRNSHLFTNAALASSQKILDILADYGLTQLLPKNTPTLQSSSSRNWTHPDNVFATEHTSLSLISCDTDPENRGPNTDHVPIVTVLDLTPPASDDTPSWNYRAVDWQQFSTALSKELEKIDPPRLLETKEDFQKAAKQLDDTLRRTVELAVPRTKPHPHQKRWWTRELTTLMGELKRLRKLAYKFRALLDHPIHAALSEKTKEVDKVIKTTKEKHWKEWLQNASGNDLWTANAYIVNPGGDGGKTRIPTLKGRDQEGHEIVASSNEEKSALLARTLFPEPPPTSSVPPDYAYPEPVEKWTDITENQLTLAINKLSPLKAPGPDGIANIVFQKCRILADYLLPLFNAAINLRTYYDPWKESTTVILRKPGKPDYSAPKAYRPIALLNTTAKLLTAIVTDHTSYILETHNLLPATHFGGRPGRTTEDSLHLLESTICHAWRQGKVVSALFLDIEGAFPNAVTDRLVHNMRKRKLPTEVVYFVERMLRDRKTQLRFDDYTSNWFEIRNGIGQGDPLSMLLYIIYDSDLVDTPKSKNELTLAFVDDTVFIAIGNSFQETHDILLDMLVRPGGGFDWSKDHNSKFEASKFALMDFTMSKSKPRPQMTIRGITIKPVPSHKFLGVIVDQELRWREHAAYAIAKGASHAMLLRRLSSPAHGISAKLIRQLYRAVAIPKMTYAASIWFRPMFHAGSPSTVRGSKGIAAKMTQVQRSAALAITGAMQTSPTDSTEAHANLYPVPILMQRILFNSTLRLTSLPSQHPLQPIVRRIAKRNVKRHKTALHHLVHGLAIKPCKTETISPHTVHPTALTPFLTQIAASKEDAISDFARCQTRTMIFTDGSCRDGKVGAAAALFINHEHVETLRYHLGKSTEHTVFEAEAVGLILAAQLLLKNEGVSFPATIFADNQAVIRSSAKPSAKPGHYLLIRFRKLIRHVLAQNNTSSSEISLNWIAGHADILGNELADKEAGRAADSANYSSPRHALPSSLHKDLPSSLSAIKQHHEAGLQSLWTGTWRKSPRHDHINSIDPSTPSRSFMKLTKNLDKKHTAIYTQLRTGHILLNKHLHCFKSSETPLCFQCDNNCPETVHHFLFNGPKYVRERHVLRIKLGRKALSTRDLLASKHAQQALFKFINDTQRLKSHIRGHPDPTEGPSLIAAQNTYTQPKT